VELVFVQLLISAGNREGNSTIAFDEAVCCDAVTQVSYHRMPGGRSIPIGMNCDIQPKVKRKYPVPVVDMVRRTRRKPHSKGWGNSRAYLLSFYYIWTNAVMPSLLRIQNEIQFLSKT
jgi:hypothetical protein